MLSIPRTEGFSGADLAFLCQGAKLQALGAADFAGEPGIEPAHFDAIIAEFGASAGRLPAELPAPA